jgi:hypothetical protein
LLHWSGLSSLSRGQLLRTGNQHHVALKAPWHARHVAIVLVTLHIALARCRLRQLRQQRPRRPLPRPRPRPRPLHATLVMATTALNPTAPSLAPC